MVVFGGGQLILPSFFEPQRGKWCKEISTKAQKPRKVCLFSISFAAARQVMISTAMIGAQLFEELGQCGQAQPQLQLTGQSEPQPTLASAPLIIIPILLLFILLLFILLLLIKKVGQAT